MGFFNKPGKATKGAINKIVRELDRVCLSNKRFQNEYGTPQPQPQPQPQPLIQTPVITEIDYEYPHYLKRNKCGLMIPLPEYYPEYTIRFAILTREPNHNLEGHKKNFNNKHFKALCPTHEGKYLPWVEYVEKTMEFVKFGHPSKEFNFIIRCYD